MGISVLTGVMGSYYYGIVEISIKKNVPPAIFLPIIGAFAIAAVCAVFLIISLYKYGWRADKTRQRLIDEVEGKKEKRLKSDAAWEHFKGVFYYPKEGEIFARYDLAQDKQLYNYGTPLAGFSSSPSCSSCGVPLVPNSYHGQMGWGMGYHCPHCKKKVDEKTPIQEFNRQAQAAFEATHRDFIRNYNAKNDNS